MMTREDSGYLEELAKNLASSSFAIVDDFLGEPLASYVHDEVTCQLGRYAHLLNYT